MSTKKKINVFAIPDRARSIVAIYRIVKDDFVLLNNYHWRPSMESIEHAVREWERYSTDYIVNKIKILN
jgi:hypothetical protein